MSIFTKLFQRKISVGSREYEQHIEEEIKFYKNIYKYSLVQPVPKTWQCAEDHLTRKIQEATGYTSAEYIVNKIKGRKKINFYSIGAGAGGVEIETLYPLFKKHKINCHFVLSDINKDVLEKAKFTGEQRGMDITIKVVDSNKFTLAENKYDLIFAHASLHHLVNLDTVTQEINTGLKKNGYFSTVDICSRNGYLLWDETLQMVNALWAALPPKFRISHTAHAEPHYMETFPNSDLAKKSFECIQSQEVVPALRRNLVEEEFVPVFAFMRRFLDTQFGPNFDLTKELDMSIINYIIQLDDYYIKSGILKPETFFGVYRKK